MSTPIRKAPGEAYVIGLDYGTDSVRAIVADAANGQEIASSVFYYPRWKEGLFCNPVTNQFRQHPSDYIEGLKATIKSCLQKVGQEVARKNKRYFCRYYWFYPGGG